MRTHTGKANRQHIRLKTGPFMLQPNNFAEYSEDIESVHSEIGRCRRCEADHLRIIKPEAMNRGAATSTVMAVGIAPGQSAINAKKAFAGNSLSRLLGWFDNAGYPLTEEQFRDRVYLTSLNKCAADPDSQANRKRLWRRCAPFLWHQIDLIKPRLILVLGREPAEILLRQEGGGWNDVLGSSLTTGQLFRNDLFPPIVIETEWLFMPHPSGLSRTMNDREVSAMVTKSLSVALGKIEF